MSYKPEKTTSKDNFYGTRIPLLWDLFSNAPVRYQSAVIRAGEEKKDPTDYIVETFKDVTNREARYMSEVTNKSKTSFDKIKTRVTASVMKSYRELFNPVELEITQSSVVKNWRDITSSLKPNSTDIKDRISGKYENDILNEKKKLRNRISNIINTERRIAERVIKKSAVNSKRVIERGLSALDKEYDKIVEDCVEKYWNQLAAEYWIDYMNEQLETLDKKMRGNVDNLVDDMESLTEYVSGEVEKKKTRFSNKIEEYLTAFMGKQEEKQ